MSFVHGSRSLVSCTARQVCFLHGAGGGGWEWNVWARVFVAAGYAVCAPDLEPAAIGLAQTQLADYSTQVRRAALSLPSPRVVIGASLGGLLALINADLADALVLVNPLLPRPWHSLLPAHEPYPDVIPWRSQGSLAGTRRALPDADDAACRYAFAHWRDESGAVMQQARAGVVIIPPKSRILVMASGRDADVPQAASLALARDIAAEVICLPQASHAGPLLGRGAARAASKAVAWLNGFIAVS